jgi:hypothetical protein
LARPGVAVPGRAWHATAGHGVARAIRSLNKIGWRDRRGRARRSRARLGAAWRPLARSEAWTPAANTAPGFSCRLTGMRDHADTKQCAHDDCPGERCTRWFMRPFPDTTTAPWRLSRSGRIVFGDGANLVVDAIARSLETPGRHEVLGLRFRGAAEMETVLAAPEMESLLRRFVQSPGDPLLERESIELLKRIDGARAADAKRWQDLPPLLSACSSSAPSPSRD